jgi:hypothetical protein
MASSQVVSFEFLLWSQLLLVWSTAAYGITADPLNGEARRFPWIRWAVLLASRAILAAVLAYGLSRSAILSGLLLSTVLLHPLLRYRLPMRWLAEFESLWMLASMVFSLAVIRTFHLLTQWVSVSISPAHQAALCVLASTLLLVVRGGTYVVRGVLRKSGTLITKERMPSPQKPSPAPSQVEAVSPVPIEIAAVAEEPVSMTVDVEEYNRGRLIGNLERIVLTIVVAAGSYAALAFLVAAKGVVRSDEFEKSRDFTEYFLIGSLASVLVALCAGMGLRFALLRLWPDLLTLQIQ